MNTKPQPDIKEIQKAIEVLYTPDAVIELRVLYKKGKRSDVGYYDGNNREALAKAAAQLNGQSAVYVTLNPIDQQLISRHANRVETYAKESVTDSNVISRRWLLVDVDPVRPKNTPATDDQLSQAKVRARAIFSYLRQAGWSDPVTADSGNGVHLLYRIDLPNDDASRDLIKGVLQTLAKQFDTPTISVDQSVFNAGRIVKLYGTVANKGDHTDAAPWRQSRITYVPENIDIVTREQLQALVPAAQVQPPRQQQSPVTSSFDFEAFMGRLGIDYQQDHHGGRERYKLARCPFNPDHGPGESAIFRGSDGVLGFKCQHNSCADKSWRDVRTLIDGDVSTRRMEPANKGSEGPTEESESRLLVVRGSNIRIRPIDWLWNGYLAQGKLHILAGAPGTGKTTIAGALAAILTSGTRWPDGTVADVGDVAVWSGEDDPEDTLAPRFIAAGADMQRIHFISAVNTDAGKRSFDPATDMASLKSYIQQNPHIKLLIVDPVVSAVAGDSHKNTEVRRNLQPLVDLGQECQCAILGISHFSKGTGGKDPVERVTGSIAFGALARIVLATAKVEDDSLPEGTRLFARAKSNIGSDTGGWYYRMNTITLKQDPDILTTEILWGDQVEGSARELLASADAMDENGGSALEEAKQFLESELALEAVPAKKIMTLARQNGISDRTLKRAKSTLKIKSKKSGLDVGWCWHLPEPPPKDAKKAEECHSKTVAPFREFGTLQENKGAGDSEILVLEDGCFDLNGTSEQEAI